MELVLLSKLGGQEVRQEYILIAWCNAIILVKKLIILTLLQF